MNKNRSRSHIPLLLAPPLRIQTKAPLERPSKSERMIELIRAHIREYERRPQTSVSTGARAILAYLRSLEQKMLEVENS